jgi:hypothetical protein
MKYSAWTNKEMVRLRECYPTMSKEELVREFAPALIRRSFVG